MSWSAEARPKLRRNGLLKGTTTKCQITLTEEPVTNIKRIMEDVAVESSTRSSNAFEAGKILELSESRTGSCICIHTNSSRCISYYRRISPFSTRTLTKIEQEP
ncbi:hypothetical protein AVEN_190986-1 [Araneus ventricosus]|uniref:Uncharacterized protein n=1 Tax=Araneus ventricosus TaxID=182803 RepID=A0A4Y2VQD1_ARAVE|nr:hypothetical protein AVEN_190986-1 [Araneus ventricosus]